MLSREEEPYARLLLLGSLGLDKLLEHVDAHLDTSTTVRSLVSGAQEVAFGIRDVLAGSLGSLATVQTELVTTPTFLTILNTSPAVLELGGAGLSALLQAVLNGHVLVVIEDLVDKETTRRRLRHAVVVCEVGIAGVNAWSRRSGLGRGGRRGRSGRRG